MHQQFPQALSHQKKLWAGLLKTGQWLDIIQIKANLSKSYYSLLSKIFFQR
jgi:hypothetical protein